MARQMSREERKRAFLELAEEKFEELEAWYDEHEDASFGEIEGEARKRRRELMGEALALLINGRDTGMQAEPPECEQCGSTMEFKGYRPWTVKGVEGDTELERAYYTCPQCSEETFFPPRS